MSYHMVGYLITTSSVSKGKLELEFYMQDCDGRYVLYRCIKTLATPLLSST